MSLSPLITRGRRSSPRGGRRPCQKFSKKLPPYPLIYRKTGRIDSSTGKDRALPREHSGLVENFRKNSLPLPDFTEKPDGRLPILERPRITPERVVLSSAGNFRKNSPLLAPILEKFVALLPVLFQWVQLDPFFWRDLLHPPKVQYLVQPEIFEKTPPSKPRFSENSWHCCYSLLDGFS
jgi:hypothetical protein